MLDMLMITAFALGVVLQSFLMLAQVRTTESFRDIVLLQLKAFGASLVAFVPSKHETNYDFSVHFPTAIVFYMVIFSLTNNKKILPIITERFLILFNIVFIYYFLERVLPLDPYSPMTNASLYLGVLFLIPSVVTFMNGLLPGRCPDWAKTFFYVWYLVMASVLLLLVVLLTSLELNMTVQINYQYWLTMFSLGMLSMSLSVDVVNVLYLLPFLGRDQSIQERMVNVKEHLKLLNSKFEDEALNPIDTVKLLLICVLIFGVNYYFLHLSDVLVVSAVFLVGRYIVGYHSQPPVLIK